MPLSSLSGSTNSTSIIFMTVIAFLIGLIIFLIFREIFCWYWKINERVSLMEKMTMLQNETAKLQADIGNLLVNIHTESQKNNKLIQELVSKSEKSPLITKISPVIPTVAEESL